MPAPISTEVEDNHAVTVEFETFGGGSDIDSEKSSSFRYCFNEHELQKLELGANMSKIVSEAEEDLGAYDHAHRSAAARGRDRDAPELAGIGGGKAANRFIAEEIDETQRMRLRAAVQTTSSCSKRLALGFCAPDAQSGLAALKSWVSALGLPRGRLLGMDYNGIPLKIEGKVYIKYNTGSTCDNLTNKLQKSINLISIHIVFFRKKSTYLCRCACKWRHCLEAW